MKKSKTIYFEYWRHQHPDESHGFSIEERVACAVQMANLEAFKHEMAFTERTLRDLEEMLSRPRLRKEQRIMVATSIENYHWHLCELKKLYNNSVIELAEWLVQHAEMSRKEAFAEFPLYRMEEMEHRLHYPEEGRGGSEWRRSA